MSRRLGIIGIAIILAALCGNPQFAGAQRTLAANVPQGTEVGGPNPAVSNVATPPLPSESKMALPYVVGSGDVLSISVWKEKELSPTVTVRPDGNISIPLIGELTVVGLTPVQIEDLLQQRLESIVVHPRVTVTAVEIHSRMVYITGEVARPGAYPLNGPLDVLQLIAQAGGLTEFASRKKIRILPAGNRSQSIAFDYNKVIRSSELGHNFPLTPGDTVVVP